MRETLPHARNGLVCNYLPPLTDDPVFYSKAPTFSVTPLSNHSSNKSKTLECRRIRIPSEVSVGMKLSGSEKGII